MAFGANQARGVAIGICLASIVGLNSPIAGASAAPPICSTRNLSLGRGENVSPQTGESGGVFTLRNHGKFACYLYGRPSVSLYDNNGRVLPFKYLWVGTQYLSQTPPAVVLLKPGARAYFLVAKYRCDIGDVTTAKTIRVYPPNATQQIFGSSAPFGLGGGFSYCKGGAKDPGNRVEISPVRATYQSM